MPRNDAEFMQRIRAAFGVEAREHLQAIASGLLALERTSPELDLEQLETVFRHTHSLKGAARAADMTRIEPVCQALEAVFVHFKRRKLALRPSDYDLLHRGFDLVGELIETAARLPDVELDGRVIAMVRQLENLGRPQDGRPAQERPGAPVGKVAPPDEAAPPNMAMPDPVTRIATPDLDQLLRSVEEMLAIKQGALERSHRLADIERALADWNKQWLALQPALRQARRASDAVNGARARSAHARLVEFTDATFGCMKALEGKVDTLSKATARDRQSAERQVDDLLLQSKNLLLLPFSTLAGLLRKVVRDLARSQGKKAELVIHGEEVRIDKRLLDQMKDPLIHLLRNAIDHGVEEPSRRVAAGKPETARLELGAHFMGGDKIELVIADDGQGIDAEAVRKAAIRAGVISIDAAAQLDHAQAVDLVFRSEVSTSPVVTEISGRGLGLAIVREHVEKLGGQVSVHGAPRAGAEFRIALPQSLGALRGLFVRVADRVFVLPAMHVEGVARVPATEVKTVRNRETVSRAGRVVALASLGEILGLRAHPGFEESGVDQDRLTVVFLEAGNETIAISVDEVLDDDETLVKKLTPPLLRVRNIAGATVSATGKVIPVLNVSDLLKSARRSDPARSHDASSSGRRRAARARVLLAEDSITSRLLLKGILESAGHEVGTAADGMEAFTALRSGNFDLLVSDIEMPRLNGFDLTARVRADPVLANLPVVLVTALASAADRERGIDAGANAYIAKGSFDQRDLLGAVRRLLDLRERA